MITTLIVLGVLAAFVAYLYFKLQKMKRMPAVADSEKLIALTDKNFGHQIKNGVTLVDFWAPWCMPCKIMAPILNEVAESVDGSYKVAKLNVDQYQSIAAKYNIRSIPTTVLFKNGNEIDRFVGVKQKDFLMKQMMKHA